MSNIPMTKPELAIKVLEQQFGHSVSFVELEDESILMGAGSIFITSSDGGLTWSKPFKAKDEKGDTAGGSCLSLVNLTGGEIGLASITTKKIYESQMTFRWSKDSGRTWSSPVVASPPLLRGHALQDTMIRTSSGRIILPVYLTIGQGGFRTERGPFVGGLVNGHFVSTAAHFYDPHFTASYVCYSDDDGRTWKKNEDGELLIQTEPGGTFEYTNEPTVVEVKPNNLLMFMRTGLGRLFQAWSDDDGETWSRPQPTELAASTAPAQLRKIPDTGHLLCVWTQQSEREIKEGFVRTRLSSAVSRNGGGVWEFFQNVHSIHEETRVEPGPIRPTLPEGRYSDTGMPAYERDADHIKPLPVGWGRWSYPSVLVTKDRALISHTYSYYDEKGVRINPGGSKLKILPLEWFYGGGDRFAENETLSKIDREASP